MHHLNQRRPTRAQSTRKAVGILAIGAGLALGALGTGKLLEAHSAARMRRAESTYEKAGVNNPKEWAFVRIKGKLGRKVDMLPKNTANAISGIALQIFGKKPGQKPTPEELERTFTAIYHHCKVNPADTEWELDALHNKMMSKATTEEEAERISRIREAVILFEAFRGSVTTDEQRAIAEFLRP